MSVKCRAKNPAMCRVHGVLLASNDFNAFVESKELEKSEFLGGEPVSVKSLKGLRHVGLLDVSQLKSESYEGAGLSVSQHPDSWRSIARLSGNTWAFQQPQNRFLDAHGLTAGQRKAVEAYGLRNGFTALESRFTVTWFDDEMDDKLTATFETYDEALDEAENYGVEPVEVQTVVATDSFPDATVKAGSSHVEDILLAVWVNETRPDLDGVWWQDNLDESRYSAPRGVITVNKIPSWLATARKVS